MRTISLKRHLTNANQGQFFRPDKRGFKLRAELARPVNRSRSPGSWSVMLNVCALGLYHLARCESVDALRGQERFLEMSAGRIIERIQVCRDGMVAATKEYRLKGYQVPASDILSRVDRAKDAILKWKATRARLFPNQETAA